MKKITVLCVLLLSLNLTAQNITTELPAQNKAYFKAGIEPASLLTFGYAMNFNNAIFNRYMISFAEISSSVFSFGIKHSDLKIGGIVPVYDAGKLKLINNLNLSFGNLETNNFNSTNFMFGDELRFGLYGKKSFLAVLAEVEHIFLSYLKHSEYYRVMYYEEAKDGWYRGGGGTFQSGIAGGVTIKNSIDTYLELKVPFTEKLKNYGGSPFHFTIGIAYTY